MSVVHMSQLQCCE